MRCMCCCTNELHSTRKCGLDHLSGVNAIFGLPQVKECVYMGDISSQNDGMSRVILQEVVLM